jgi:ABC-type Fe3+-siderophore transport system permease subunit
LFVDLFDVRVEGEAWPADMLLIGEPRACMFALTTIVTARATSRMPAADEVAKSLGVDAEAIDWKRLALAE